MINKFKAYLENEFQVVAPTKENLHFKEETLNLLVDRAQEYRIKGMTDEGAIYELCIDSLGDLKKTLLDKETKKITEEKIKNKVSASVIFSTILILVITAAYLIASFVTEAWSKTWLIMVGGIFLCITSGSVLGIIKAEKNKKHIISRICCALIITLSSVFIFLVLQILFKINGSYLTFLVMAILIVGVDTLLAYFTHSASFFAELLIFIIESASLLYVILGITNVVSWHPYWLIPALAGILDIVILILGIFIYCKKRKENKFMED